LRCSSEQASASFACTYLPSPCLTEARQAIRWKCQPREESEGVRSFLARALAEQTISREHERIVRETLAKFERQLHSELSQLDEVIDSLLRQDALDVYPLNERMLARAVELSVLDLYLKPFDQAILAAVLVRAEELSASGETDLSFCETDADLQPWDRGGKAKQPLTRLYNQARVSVYGDFALRDPEPENWGETPSDAQSE
jgi:hypothetical protein